MNDQTISYFKLVEEIDFILSVEIYRKGDSMNINLAFLDTSIQYKTDRIKVYSNLEL